MDHPARIASFLEPGTERFIDALAARGDPPIYTLKPAAAREALAHAQAQPVAKRPAVIEDATISSGPTGSVRVRIAHPEGSNDALPVVMQFRPPAEPGSPVRWQHQEIMDRPAREAIT